MCVNLPNTCISSTFYEDLKIFLAFEESVSGVFFWSVCLKRDLHCEVQGEFLKLRGARVLKRSEAISNDIFFCEELVDSFLRLKSDIFWFLVHFSDLMACRF